jgi:hypothetical protein
VLPLARNYAFLARQLFVAEHNRLGSCVSDFRFVWLLKGLNKREPIIEGFCALTNFRLLLLEDNGNVQVIANKDRVERVEGSSDVVSLIVQIEKTNATESDVRLGNAHRRRRLQVTQIRGLIGFDGDAGK